MRLSTLITVAVLLCSMQVEDAAAQLSLWFDTRDDIAEVENPDPDGRGGFINEPHGGGRGDGQFMGIAPKLLTGAHIVGQFDSSTSSLTLYADYDAPPGTVLVSLGIDIEVDPPAGYQLHGLTVELFDTPSEIGGNLTSNAWDTVTFSTPPSATGVGIQATRTHFGPGLGIPAGRGYRLARLNFEADDRNCVVAGPPMVNSTLRVVIRVNAVLITERSAAGATTPVQLNLGYLNGAPEPANGDGGTIGTTSQTADATINVRMKADFTDDGTVNDDIAGFLNARFASIAGTANVIQTWLGDLTGDGLVNNADIRPFQLVRAEGITCP